MLRAIGAWFWSVITILVALRLGQELGLPVGLTVSLAMWLFSAGRSVPSQSCPVEPGRVLFWAGWGRLWAWNCRCRSGARAT